MRELRIQVQGYIGPERSFVTIAEAWAAFPPGEFPGCARKARAWLVPGCAAEVYGAHADHVLIVEAGQ